MALQIQTVVSMPFSENTYIAWADGRADCLVIDPGTEPDAILDFLTDRGLTPAAVLNTHGHADHIAGNADLKAAYPAAPIVIGVNDAPLLTDPGRNVSRSFGFDVVSPPADQTVREGDTLSFAGIDLEIFDVPGHSPGHVVFLARGAGVLFGGDVLFRGSIGRTDLPGGNLDTLVASIRTRLLVFPDETPVYPGHGPPTTIGHERRTNPFLAGG